MKFLPFVLLLLLLSTSFAWMNASFLSMQPCAIQYNTTPIASSLTNYPAYCVINTQRLIAGNEMQSNCADLRVGSSAGVPLLYEIVNNTCNTTLTYVWFLVPATAAGANDTVNLYYNNATVTDAQNATELWRLANYSGVYHTAEKNGSMVDSTGNNLLTNVTSGGGSITYNVTGPRGFGVLMSSASSSQGARFKKTTPVGVPTGVVAYTITWWQNKSTNDGCDGGGIFSMGNAGTNSIVYVNQRTIAPYYLRVGYNTAATGPSFLPYNAWQFFAVNNSGSTTSSAFKNGTLINNTLTTDGGAIGTTVLEIGGDDFSSGDCNIISMAEIRIRNGTSSVDWQAAQYGQTSSMGAEVNYSATPQIVSLVSPTNASSPSTLPISLTWNVTGNYLSYTCNATMDGAPANTTNVTTWAADLTLEGNAMLTGYYEGEKLIPAYNGTLVSMTFETGCGHTSSSAYLQNAAHATLASSSVNATTGIATFNYAVVAGTTYFGVGYNVDQTHCYNSCGGSGNSCIYPLVHSMLNYTAQYDSYYGEHQNKWGGIKGINITNTTIVMAQNIPTANNTNTAHNVTVPLGTHTWNVTCTNGTTTNSSATWTFTYISSIISTLVSPANASTSTNTTQTFTWNCTTGYASYLADLYIDSAQVASSIPSANSTNTSYGIVGVAPGTHNWSVTCVNSSMSNSSATWTLYRVSTLNVTPALAANYEASTSTMNITIAGNANLDNYSINVTYNNTVLMSKTVTGLSNLSYVEQVNVTAPLVAANLTNISYNVSVSASVGGNQTTNTSASTHTIYLAYLPTGFTFTPTTASTIEAGNSVSVIVPAITGPANVTYTTYAFSLPFCIEFLANGSSLNTTCVNRTITDVNSTYATYSASHLYKPGVIFEDVFVQGDYSIYLSSPAEAVSLKALSVTANASREYFVWLVNSTNGTINGTAAGANTSTIYNISFYSEATLAALTLDSASATHTVTFPDGAQKSFTIYRTTVNSIVIRAYPSAAIMNLSSQEIFSATNYSTRARFIPLHSTSFSTEVDGSVYFMPLSGATYGLVYVIRNANPVSSVYVSITKNYAATGSYIDLGQIITDSSGMAGTYVQLDAWYKFYVYAQNGTLLYASSQPQQFVCSTSPCRITLDIASINQTFATPITGEMWQDVKYSILPAAFYVNSPTNITFNITSAAASLQYWGMNVTRLANTSNCTIPPCTIPVCFGNVTIAAGGTLYCTINSTGMYYVTAWFKDGIYQQFDTGVRGIQYINSSFGFGQLRETIAATPPLSAWSYYFIAVVVAMVVGGFVSRYTMDGAGLVGLAVLWIFTLLYPGGQLVQLMGSTYITIMYATIITTIAVVAAMYAVWRGN